MSLTMAYTLKLNWLPFNINLAKVQWWMSQHAGPAFCGLSANKTLDVHFTATPSADLIAKVQAYWNGLTPKSGEATFYFSGQKLKDAISSAKAATVTSSWDQLSEQQKKMIMGVPLTENDNYIILNQFSKAKGA